MEKVEVGIKDKKGDSVAAPLHEAFFSDGTHKLPIVRLSSIELNGFKGVEHGEIILENEKKIDEYGPHSTILGIYGQNGSGKTSLIQAISILGQAMAGVPINKKYCDCISAKSSTAKLRFSFILKYDNEVRLVEYSFSIEKARMTDEEIQELTNDSQDGHGFSYADSVLDEELFSKIRLFNETIKLSRITKDNKTRLQTVITTEGGSMPFGPNIKVAELIGQKKDVRTRMSINRESALEKSKSFIFDKTTLATFVECGISPLYYETLLALQNYSILRLFVVDTRVYSAATSSIAPLVPILTTDGPMPGLVHPNDISIEVYDKMSHTLAGISEVLGELVPGLSIRLNKISDTILKNGNPGYRAMLMAKRKDVEIPLRFESDGIRKIISILGLITAAYNDNSVTVAIDEFDAGVFEYLLGEILQSFEESGEGQFVFTSHNLRPLEVINKRSLAFTTTNENNRYYRFKDLSSSNNLRDRYFREIILGGQEESLYNSTKRFKIEAAMRRAYKK